MSDISPDPMIILYFALLVSFCDKIGVHNIWDDNEVSFVNFSTDVEGLSIKLLLLRRIEPLYKLTLDERMSILGIYPSAKQISDTNNVLRLFEVIRDTMLSVDVSDQCASHLIQHFECRRSVYIKNVVINPSFTLDDLKIDMINTFDEVLSAEDGESRAQMSFQMYQDIMAMS